MTGHPASGLDDIVHQRVRLGILTIAHEARRVEFSYLRDSLDLTAGNLSQHLGVLENAGLITIEKGFAGKRARTWVMLTDDGEAALSQEIVQLKLLISQIEGARTAIADRPAGRRLATGSADGLPQGAACLGAVRGG
jgi:DNA-binding MarR family transcriptional regulator